MTLSALTADGEEGLYPQVKIYDSSNVVVSTVDLVSVEGGLYTAQFTPNTAGIFVGVVTHYADAAHTVLAGYTKDLVTIDVNSIKTNILRILGLLHQNAVVDNTTYDVDGNMLSGRVRCYDTKVNAQAAEAVSPAAYNTGKTFEYQVTAEYNSSKMTKYTMVQVL